jgi:hypothetical protein
MAPGRVDGALVDFYILDIYSFLAFAALLFLVLFVRAFGLEYAQIR